MQPKHIFIFLGAFLLVAFVTVIFVRWLTPKAELPVEYQKEMKNYDARLKLILESKQQNDKVIEMADKVLRLYDQNQLVYKSVLNKNDIEIKLIQKEYEKNNRFDTVGTSELLRYVTDYKKDDNTY